MSVTIFHNPKCSTSRHVLELLEARGAALKVVAYLDDPPTPAELDAVLKKMGGEPDDLLRTRNAPEDAMKAWERAASREAKIKVLSSHPILIERPVVIAGRNAALVRPKAEAEAILDRIGA